MFTIRALLADMKMRLDVAKELFKRSGDLAPKGKIDVNVNVKHRDMGLEDRIALAQLQRGDSVAPEVIQDLVRRGLYQPTQIPARVKEESRMETLEGEYSVIDNSQTGHQTPT